MSLDDRFEGLMPEFTPTGFAKLDSQLLNVIARLGVANRGKDHRDLHGRRRQWSNRRLSVIPGFFFQTAVHR